MNIKDEQSKGNGSFWRKTTQPPTKKPPPQMTNTQVYYCQLWLGLQFYVNVLGQSSAILISYSGSAQSDTKDDASSGEK